MNEDRGKWRQRCNREKILLGKKILTPARFLIYIFLVFIMTLHNFALFKFECHSVTVLTGSKVRFGVANLKNTMHVIF